MWKTIVVVGAAAAIVGGAGTAALASSQTTAPTLPASSSTSAALDTSVNEVDTSVNESSSTADKHPAIGRLRRAVHVTWVTQNKQEKTFITHQGIRGEVTSVSASSITVKAADDVTRTYVINASTKVRDRASKAAGSISQIKAGDPVLVTGTGTTTLTAVHIVETRK